LLIRLGVVLLLLLAIGIPAASAQIENRTVDNRTADNATDTGNDNATDSGDAADGDGDLPPSDDAEVSSPSVTNVVINEVELNPRGSDVGREWIELYNPAETETNMSDFEIRTSFKSETIRLPLEAMIEANGTYVVELDRQTLSNTAESLVLANSSGETIDRTPSLVDRSDDGRTWQRIPDGDNEWQFALGTRDQLNDPDEQASSTYSARSGSAQCLGTAGCAEGTVTRIVDGDTLYVKVNNTTYKVDLALASAPSRAEQGFIESRSFTQSLCLGSNVLVDQDDELLTSETSVIAVAYCGSTNLNSELLDSGYATLDLDQCETSEFATQRWARDHGC
jgi:endonuclease YncB( thermonuclease family)